jgi:hypothetical protein
MELSPTVNYGDLQMKSNLGRRRRFEEIQRADRGFNRFKP